MRKKYKITLLLIILIEFLLNIFSIKTITISKIFLDYIISIIFLIVFILNKKNRKYLIDLITLKRLLLYLACKTNFFERDAVIFIDNSLIENDSEPIDNFTLFEYIIKIKDKRFSPYYILNIKNPLYEKIKKQYNKNIISYSGSNSDMKIILKLFKTRFWLDSFQSLSNFFPQFQKRLFKSKYITTVYTQHGINYFKYSMHFKKIIGQQVYNKVIYSNEVEKNTILKNMYGYKEENCIKNGLFRWDKLQNTSRKIIFIYFTFRSFIKKNPENFQQTRYYSNIKSLLDSQKLNHILRENNIELKIAMHHVLSNEMKVEKISNLEIVNDCDVNNIKNISALLITDYSSMAFDFLIKNKPVIFYRLDSDEQFFNKNDIINNENIEFRNNEIFNVLYNETDVINMIKYYIENDFQLEKEKQEKADKFFYYKDNFCERFYDWMIENK